MTAGISIKKIPDRITIYFKPLKKLSCPAIIYKIAGGSACFMDFCRYHGSALWLT